MSLNKPSLVSFLEAFLYGELVTYSKFTSKISDSTMTAVPRNSWVGALLMVAAAEAAFSQDSWNVPAGIWSIDANWADLTAPAASDDAVISNNGAANVNTAGAVAQDVFVGVSPSFAGLINVLPGGFANFSSLELGVSGFGNMTVSGPSATVNATSGVSLGVNATGSGQLIMTNPGSLLRTPGGPIVIGVAGAGDLQVLNSATINASASSLFRVGQFAGSTGSVLISNSGIIQNVWTAQIGSGGNGTLSVTDGGLFDCDYLTLAHNPSSQGQALVSNGTMAISQDLVVGYFGNGSLTVSAGGGVVANGIAHAIGRDASGNGTVTLTGAGSGLTFSGQLRVGESGKGRLEVLNGATLSGADLAVAQFDNQGVLIVSGVSSNATLTGNITSQDLIEVSAGGRLKAHSLKMLNTANTTVSGTPGARGVLEVLYVDSQSSSDVLIFDGGVFRARGNMTEVFPNFEFGGFGGFLIVKGEGLIVDPAGFTIQTDALITGNGTVTVNGTGSFTMTGPNTYTGDTTISSGTLLVNNSFGSATGTGSVTVQSGATIGGAGQFSGSLNVTNGATLAPGNSPGTLYTGSLTLNGTLAAEINGVSPTLYDIVDVTGTVNLGTASTLSLVVGFTPSLGDMFFLIRNDGSDAITGLLNGWSQNATFSLGGYDWQISYEGHATFNTFLGGNDLVLQVIPEPASWALIVSSLTTIILFRRRR